MGFGVDVAQKFVWFRSRNFTKHFREGGFLVEQKVTDGRTKKFKLQIIKLQKNLGQFRQYMRNLKL